MRQEHYETGRSRRARRSSGRAYAEIMRGRQEQAEAGQSRGSRRAHDRYSRDEDPEEVYYGDDYDDNYDDYDESGDIRNDDPDEAFDGEYDESLDAGRHSGQKGTGGRSVKHRKKKKKKPVLWILLGLILVFGGYVFGKNLLQGDNWTVAVFGVDSRDGNLEKNTRSDVIMLVNINKKTHEVKLASVYRDTYLRVNDDSEYNKINKAYEEGGHAQAVAALEENLDIKIDDYMTFSWAAVAKGINELGGIDLEISDAEFSIINAFITETVNSTGIGSVQLTHAGMQHLDGVQAVAYGRLRLIDTDFNRTARQRKVLSLALDKAKQADPGKLVSLAAALLPEVSTSIGVDDIAPMLRNISAYQLTETKGFPFSLQTKNIGKMDCVIPTTLASNVELLHQFLYGEDDYKASARVQEISARIANDSGLTEAGNILSDFGTDGGVIYHTPEPETAAPVQTEAVLPSESETSDAEETETTETEEAGAGESVETEEGEATGETKENIPEETESRGTEVPENGTNAAGPGSTAAQERETGAHENGPTAAETPQIGDRPSETMPEISGGETAGTNGPGSAVSPDNAGSTAGPGTEVQPEAVGPGV